MISKMLCLSISIKIRYLNTSNVIQVKVGHKYVDIIVTVYSSHNIFNHSSHNIFKRGKQQT